MKKKKPGGEETFDMEVDNNKNTRRNKSLSFEPSIIRCLINSKNCD